MLCQHAVIPLGTADNASPQEPTRCMLMQWITPSPRWSGLFGLLSPARVARSRSQRSDCTGRLFYSADYWPDVSKPTRGTHKNGTPPHAQDVATLAQVVEDEIT